MKIKVHISLFIAGLYEVEVNENFAHARPVGAAPTVSPACLVVTDAQDVLSMEDQRACSDYALHAALESTLKALAYRIKQGAEIVRGPATSGVKA